MLEFFHNFLYDMPTFVLTLIFAPIIIMLFVGMIVTAWVAYRQ